MKTIKFSKSSFWFKYWKFINFRPDEWEYPQDTCSLKRSLMVYTAIALFTLPSFLVFQLASLSSKLKEVFQGAIIYIVLTVFQILGMLGMLVKESKFTFFDAYILFPMTVALTIVFLFFFIISIDNIVTAYKKAHPKKYIEKEPGIIKSLYLSWKDKLCSKIEYVD